MNPYFPHLFSPMKVKKTTYRNRIFAAPTAWKDLTDLNHLNEQNITFLAKRAAGGAAVVNLGDCYVHPTGVVDYSYKLKLYDIRCENSLFNCTTAIKSFGGVASIELNHAGMHFHDDNRINYGPSDMVDEFDQGDGQGKHVHEIREMPIEVIEEVVDAFGKSALRAKHCGFGQVLLHAGHGWLLSQFLSPVINRRTDEFGGSLENRARFSTMVLDRIRHYCGNDFPIEVRVSWKEGMTEGCQLEDTIEFCKLLEAHGADMIHVSCGSLHFPDTNVFTHPSWFNVEEGLNLEAAIAIKKQLKIKVGTVGGITDPALMEQWIADGLVDYIVVARGLIADPELPNKAMHGRVEDIRPCLKCLLCHTGTYYHMPMFCSVNPTIGRDKDYVNPAPPKSKKKVLIAGGGPAGMEAALTAAMRGHEVILCEKKGHLGGLLPTLEKEPFKIRITMYREYMIRKLKEYEVDVRLNTEVTPQLVQSINPDKLIAAVGGKPTVPPVKGIENGISILDLYDNDIETGDTVAVLGGGFAGVECAIGLAMKGKKVTVVEMTGAIASGPETPAPGPGVVQLDALWYNADKNNVEIMLNTKCIEITNDGMLCRAQDGSEVMIIADSVVYAAGMTPDESVVEALRESVIDFSWIGDCYATGLIKTAVHQGFDVAMSL